MTPKLIGKYNVPSKSEKGKSHIVGVYDSGDVRCGGEYDPEYPDGCMAYQMKNTCSHVEKVAAKLRAEGKLPEREELNEAGALWQAVTREGRPYFFGNFVTNGLKYNIVVFKVREKQTPKHPDFKIFIKDIQEKNDR